MNISPNNDKIEKYLDELSDEYKTLLFNALVSRSKSLDNLSVSELLRLDSEIKKPLFEDYQKQQKRRRTVLIAGLMYMFLGFFFFIFYQVIGSDFSYSATDIIPLFSVVIGFMGLFLSVFSFALPTLNLSTKRTSNMKDESPALLEYQVITKWRDLEGIVNDISIDNDVKTPRSIIGYLSENNFIDSNEYKQLKDFLKMRNDIVHSTGKEYKSNEIKDMVDSIDKIIGKLKKII